MAPRGSQGRFQHQLTGSLIVGMMALMLSTSILISWWITAQLKGRVMDYATQVTGQFAENSVLAFLIENESVSKQIVTQVGAFPGIRYVAILALDTSVIVAEGDQTGWRVSEHTGAWQQRPALAGEERQAWHFVAPVIAASDGFSHQEYQTRPRVTSPLGYVHLTLDKAPWHALFLSVVVTTLCICIVFSVLLIVWLDRRMRRLTRPLQELASRMIQAQEGRVSLRAAEVGPEEVREIAMVFNRMMAAIEQHREALEAEVAIRTFELQQARDTALTAVRYKSQVMANITHEMRSPLQAIDGYTRIARKELRFLEDQQYSIDSLNIVLTSTAQLLTLIDQILDLARIEAGKMDVHLAPLSLPALLNEVDASIQPLARRNANRLTMHFSGQNEIDIDRDKLYQILLNLLTNACKFTHDGTVELRVKCSAKTLQVEVKDSGIGILKAHQDQIFDAFRKIDPPDERKYPGTGIGLTITQQMCQLLGGEMGVQSKPWNGSTFTVVIPLPIVITAGEALISSECHSAGVMSDKPEAPPCAQTQASIDSVEAS